MAFGLTSPDATAVLDGPYRYSLTRTWSAGPRICWIMLNPSTADASQDDPTIRRCIAFSKRWSYGSLEVVNLFALRATRSIELSYHQDPVGPLNDCHIRKALDQAGRAVAAWGAHGRSVERVARVRELTRVDLWCLGLTKDRHPRHPLYVLRDAQLRVFEGAAT